MMNLSDDFYRSRPEEANAAFEREFIRQADPKSAAPVDNDFRGATLRDLAYSCLRRMVGAGAMPQPENQIFRALQMSCDRSGYEGTSDFTGVVANVAENRLLAGWNAVIHSWRKIARITEVNSFRRTNRSGLSEMPVLEAVPEHGEIKTIVRAGRTEYITGQPHVGIFGISRESILADDVTAFTRVPFEAGIAADATVNKAVFDLLTSNSGTGPVLSQDSVALFDAATHLNYTASSGGITVANWDVGERAMRGQTDPQTLRRLNIPPTILLCPPELASEARVLVASMQLWNNPDNYQLVVEAQLSDATNGATAFYMLADPQIYDALDVAFVGAPQPYLENREGWSVDGVEYKIRADFGVAATDFRAVYRKRGA